MPPTDAVGQVSFSPATQTTVVKTTTTTTVSFPPFVLNAPKDLADRDPEIFPLAAIPTPPCLKKLRFPVGSRIAQFEELDDAHQALRQVSQPAGCVSEDARRLTNPKISTEMSKQL